jgi:cell division protein FtsB
MSKKQKYIVTKPGCCFEGITETPVGKTVELTEQQAANKAGKVRLLSEHQAETADSKAMADENAALKAENAELKKQLDALMNELQKPAPKKAPAKKASK